MTRSIGALALLVAALPAAASDRHEFPQFRTLSGLPGGGFGVSPDGRPDFRGAMAYTTPIAYNLQGWNFVLGGSLVGKKGRIRFGGSEADTNGTAQLLVGVPIGEWGQLTLAHMELSTIGDNAQNLSWTPPGQTGSVRFALGVQDISGQGGTISETNRRDPGESRSYYVVGTWQANPDLFVSLGTGDTRFQGLFGNLSWNAAPRLKALLEYDTYSWNAALAYDLGRIGEVRRGVPATAGLMIGVVRRDQLMVTLNFGF